MAGPRHQRDPSSRLDVLKKELGTLDISDTHCAGLFLEELSGIEDQQPVAPDDLPSLVHNAQPIGVSVIGHPQVRLRFPHGPPQIGEIGGDCWIRVVMWK